MSVIVRMKVEKKSFQKHYSLKEDGVTPNIQTEILLSVPYCNDKNDPNYVYAQLSSGSHFPLTTINQDAADQFKLGEVYEIVITKVGA